VRELHPVRHPDAPDQRHQARIVANRNGHRFGQSSDDRVIEGIRVLTNPGIIEEDHSGTPEQSALSSDVDGQVADAFVYVKVSGRHARLDRFTIAIAIGPKSMTGAAVG
jgi:hypothetical protein